MELYITNRTLKEVIKQLGDHAKQLGYKSWMHDRKKATDKIEVSLDELDVHALTILRNVMKEMDEEDTSKVSKLLNALKDTENKSVPSLKDFPKFFTLYMKENGNPMLHSLHADLRGVAYLPISVSYEDAKSRHDEPSVCIELGYNTKMSYKIFRVHLRRRHMNASVPTILRNNNLMVPDETMVADYEKIKARFEDYGSMQGEQFWVKGGAPVMGSSDWWSRSDEVNLTHGTRPTKAVLDVDSLNDRMDRASVLQHSEVYNARRPVPTHPVLPMFSLAHHKMVWVNVVNMRKYKYEEGLRDKLVLPASHSRLISALVSNLDALRSENEAEDKSRTIKAKASSSIILAKGPAGTGKTLTSEVYAEEIKRPLYEVQSGQIGVEPEEIETNLLEILARSIRLRMPLLVNEADVFIQSRGRDLKQNAVVSVFLRLLEYHTGLIFLTTNRSDDIDDAILSRCIAEIQYGIPAPRERLKLWHVMLSEFNVSLPEPDIRKAVLAFPEVVGRDIQNIIRLTNRVCTAVEEPFSLQAMRDNAIFKGILVLTDAELAAEIEKRKVKA